MFTLPDMVATMDFGAKLSRGAKSGDVFALVGTLGAGKSTLARGFIRALTSPNEDVPSPTFTIVQSYTQPAPNNTHAALTIWHVDAYRLTDPSEAEELGLEDAFDQAICLVEWPDRIATILPPERTIWIKLEAVHDTAGRSVRIAAPPGWLQSAGF